MSGIIKSSGEPHSMPAVRKLANGRLSPTSPLKVFGQAKKRINEIFTELTKCVVEASDFMSDLEKRNLSLVTPEEREKFKNCKKKVEGVIEILKRDRMKVAFFGRTSNGKSSVINAMLRNKILPSGMGHTTNCFLQVEGVSDDDALEGPYFVNADQPDVRNYGLKNLGSIANAQSKAKLDNDALITVFYPKDRCPLLRDDVVLMDSPGIDVSPDLDGWIVRFCLDADVFVLVANAESTLMQTEKNFFHKVSERLSKPNIFILNNRWDASDSELETMLEVKQQHMERNIQFLADELKVCTHQEAADRVFFVSAKEALASRVLRDAGTPTPAGGEMKEGFHRRLFEFENFERKFEECISQSAVETKFALHAQNGAEIVRFVCSGMNRVCCEAANKREQLEEESRERRAHLEATNHHVKELTEQIREKIHRMTEEVEVKVGSALAEEIKRLSILVDTFEVPFSCEPELLQNYKNKLNAHIECGLSTNLESRCNEALNTAVVEASNYMSEQLLHLIPVESRPKEFVGPCFEMKYRLDCSKLCSDFQENIEFQFSYGFTSMLRRYTGIRKSAAIPYGLSPAASTSEIIARGAQGDESELVINLLNTFSSLYSRTTIGVLVLSGMLAKAVGWRLFALLGTSYALLYAYERLSWTTGAKEKEFKRQYVDYASRSLRGIADFTSTNCSDQVQHELNSTFGRLLHHVEENCKGVSESLKTLEATMQALDEASKKAVIVKNKAQFADRELNNFITTFIKTQF